MLAVDIRARVEERARRVGGPWNCLVTPETFRVVVEAEVARHHRYLGGFGLLRMGPRDGEQGSDALREAFETETRRTDTGCLLPDGSCALLALHVRTKHLAALVERLREAAQALHEQYESEPANYVAGIALAHDKRVDADEVWLALCRAYEDARRTHRLVRMAR